MSISIYASWSEGNLLNPDRPRQHFHGCLTRILFNPEPALRAEPVTQISLYSIMHSRMFRTLVLAASIGLTSWLSATTAEPPSVGDLREEQRIILNAYLIRGEQFVGKSKEQLADNILRASKENGF